MPSQRASIITTIITRHLTSPSSLGICLRPCPKVNASFLKNCAPQLMTRALMTRLWSASTAMWRVYLTNMSFSNWSHLFFWMRTCSSNLKTWLPAETYLVATTTFCVSPCLSLKCTISRRYLTPILRCLRTSRALSALAGQPTKNILLCTSQSSMRTTQVCLKGLRVLNLRWRMPMKTSSLKLRMICTNLILSSGACSIRWGS